jgi:hypothetical protein
MSAQWRFRQLRALLSTRVAAHDKDLRRGKRAPTRPYQHPTLRQVHRVRRDLNCEGNGVETYYLHWPHSRSLVR